ncbi:hypothetical protein IIA95_03410 [Patescibacteria group bacterium]|nr:hypothetical protein [Patescibacteria group bacterium]
MPAQLIPAINVDSFEEVIERVRLIEPLAEKFGIEYLHLDVADGTFTPNTIWHEATDLVGFKTSLAIEVHLMITDIDRRIEKWLFDPIKRIIFHLEAGRDPDLVIEKCRDAKKEVGLAIRPETAWEKTKPFWDKVDFVQSLSVSPGRAGQRAHINAVDKVRTLRHACPSCIIEVDGGVNADNAGELVKAGANLVVAASAIFGSEDIEQAILNLKSKINPMEIGSP